MSEINVKGIIIVEGIDGKLSVPRSRKLNALVLPKDATNKTVIWNSDDSSIAAVNNQGLVTAVTPGLTTITATTEDGDFIATYDLIIN